MHFRHRLSVQLRQSLQQLALRLSIIRIHPSAESQKDPKFSSNPREKRREVIQGSLGINLNQFVLPTITPDQGPRVFR